jgi:putative transposase
MFRSYTYVGRDTTKMNIASFMEYLKGKSILRIFDKYSTLKYRYGRRLFLSIGYYVSTVGKIKEYIRNQLNVACNQISIN